MPDWSTREMEYLIKNRWRGIESLSETEELSRHSRNAIKCFAAKQGISLKSIPEILTCPNCGKQTLDLDEKKGWCVRCRHLDQIGRMNKEYDRLKRLVAGVKVNDERALNEIEKEKTSLKVQIHRQRKKLDISPRGPQKTTGKNSSRKLV